MYTTARQIQANKATRTHLCQQRPSCHARLHLRRRTALLLVRNSPGWTAAATVSFPSFPKIDHVTTLCTCTADNGAHAAKQHTHTHSGNLWLSVQRNHIPNYQVPAFAVACASLILAFQLSLFCHRLCSVRPRCLMWLIMVCGSINTFAWSFVLCGKLFTSYRHCRRPLRESCVGCWELVWELYR